MPTSSTDTVVENLICFLGGVGVSALLIVVVPPLDLVLLAGLLLAVILQVANGRRDPRLVAMLLGVTVFSIYGVIWVLTNSGSGASNGYQGGLALERTLFSHRAGERMDAVSASM
jgi:4-amino-4-deoxy-L-arabinose transferase-like glycosyltransferase